MPFQVMHPLAIAKMMLKCSGALVSNQGVCSISTEQVTGSSSMAGNWAKLLSGKVVVVWPLGPCRLAHVLMEPQIRRENVTPSTCSCLSACFHLSSVFAVLTSQVIIMQTPVNMFFKVVPLNGIEWAVSIGIGLTAFPVSFATRLLSR